MVFIIITLVVNDHLDNLRVSFRDNDAAPVSGVYKPPVLVQANDYDPWGLDINSFQQNNHDNFKYSGKEQYKEFGLDWYDFGARMYDAPIGRWHAVDPLADISRRFSPYVYGNNNPLRFIDPSGMASEDFTYSDGYSSQSYANSSGVVGVSGNYTSIGEDGCPPNCANSQEPIKGGFPNGNLQPASQQNAIVSQGKFIKTSPEDEAAQLGFDIAGVVEGGYGLLKRGASFLKNGFKVGETTKSGIGLSDAFLSSATKPWGEQGLTNVGRALQKHAGRDGSVFQEIKFSHKTANQDGLDILNQL